jgi:hypothetical protein
MGYFGNALSRMDKMRKAAIERDDMRYPAGSGGGGIVQGRNRPN